MKMRVKSENYSHNEGVDAEGGVSHDVKEASTSCGCAWLGKNNLKENVVKYFDNFVVFFCSICPNSIGESANKFLIMSEK